MYENDGKGPAESAEAETTRREWLLRVGEATVLIGWSGLEGGAAQTSQAPAPLPPGLYAPSIDHLSHALAGKDLIVSIPVGSETEFARPRPEPFEARFFSRQEFQAVERMIGWILGERPAAGIVAEIATWVDFTVADAGAVGAAARALAPEHRILAVQYYGSEAVQELENADPQEICREGLAWLEEEASRRHGKGFAMLSEPEQAAMLKLISDSVAPQTEHAGSRLFQWVKRMAIRGFYTSRMGLEELEYKGNYYYASPPGCEEHRH